MTGSRQPRKKKAAPDAAAELRRQAEELHRQTEERLGGLSAAAPPLSADAAAAVHELRVHQIELEMQNEELRRAQLEIGASRAKYLELFDLAPVGYLTISDKGIVGDANLTAAHLLGVDRRQIVGQPCSIFIFAADRREYYRHLELLRQTEAPQSCELRLQPVGAEPFWAHLDGRPQGAANGEPLRYHLTFTDVHQRVLAEEAVREGEAKYRGVVERATDGIVIIRDNVLIFTNKAFATMSGYAEHELVDMPFLAMVPPAQHEAITERVRRRLAGERQPTSYEIDLVRKDGTRFTAEVNAGVITYEGAPADLVLLRDISKRKAAQEALRENEQRSRLLSENTPDVMSIQDRDLRYDWVVNPVLGLSPEDVIGKTDRDLLDAEQFEIVRALKQQVVDSGAPMSVEIPLRDAQGRESIYDGAYIPRRDADGDVNGILSYLRDVTTRKQTERLLSVPSEILAIIASPAPVPQAAEGIVAALKKATGFDAVGLRLQEGDDYPFVSAVGYSEEFLQAENTLAARYPDGGLCRDADGAVSLECTCGLVVTGKADPENPLFTTGGSAWINDALPLLELPPEDDPRLNPRNRCIHVGFLSIALIPLRAGDEILGLLHLADRRTDRFTPESIRFFEGIGASIGVALLGKRAEEALHESERQLDEAYRLAHIGAWQWNAGTDTVTWAEELYRIAGRDPKLPAPSYAEHAGIIAPESWSRLQAAVGKALETGEAYELELRLVRPDGTTRWVRSFGGAARDDQGRIEGLYGTFQDVTELVRAEEALRESEKRLANAVEGSGVGLWDWQVQTGEETFSERWAGIVGYTLAELAPTSIATWRNLCHPEDLRRANALIEEHFSGHSEIYVCETRMRHKDRHWVWVLDQGKVSEWDSDGRPLRVTGTQLDITARKQAEEKIARTLSLLESTMEATADGILVADGKGGMVRSNMRFREIWGIPEAIAASEDDDAALDFVLGQLKEPQLFLKGVRALYGTPERTSFDVLELKDGRVLERYSQPQRIDDAVVGRVWSFRDVTARRRAEGKLAQLNAELVREADALAEANATITRIAATDDLTGLANRRCFYEALEKAVSLARRHGSPLALVSLDLDGLKRVNDNAGHEAGDEVLASFAALLRDRCRAEDLPGRLGGDEFSVLLPGMELGGGCGLAERLLAAVRSCEALQQRGVTVSGGIAAWTPDESPEDLLRRADQALYAAKRSGGDAVAADA